LFYITSQGHSATSWLSNILNQTPKIVCFHGTRSIPPFENGLIDLNEKEFTNALLLMNKNTFLQKIFGACHGFYGNSMRDLTLFNKGSYFAILRNPILIVESIFNTFLPHHISNEDENVKPDTNFSFKDLLEDLSPSYQDWNKADLIYKKNFVYYKNFEKNLDTTDKIFRRIDLNFKKLKRNFNFSLGKKIEHYYQDDFIKFRNNDHSLLILSRVLRCFHIACIRTIYTDYEIFKECEEKEIIKMEKMTDDYEYLFDSIVSKIDKDLSKKNFYDFTKFNDHKRIHTKKKIKDPLYIFNSWPSLFQDIFKKYISKKDILKRYSQYGYKI
jgi:hypothetical protein